MSFDPGACRVFRFTRYAFDETEAVARLEYALDKQVTFCETLHFPGARLPLDASRRAALHRVLYHLHLVAGISYYKAALPPAMQIETGLPDLETASFLDTLYLHGLGEFAYRNDVDLRTKIRFPRQAVSEPPLPAMLPAGIVLPLGGGKDSLVALHALLAGERDVRLFSVGHPAAIIAVAKATGLPHLIVQRRIDPHLFELNRQGAYNGHVPISAIIAYILAVAAILYDFDTVVMANERSANSGNVMLPPLSAEKEDGFEINHQYSKSLAFEQAVQTQFARILPGFRYFSLLRGLSELDIARQFSYHTDFHTIFSSCNANYKIHASSGHSGRWCLNCPKCRFVFLSLAPFLSVPQMMEIFGANLLADPGQQAGFDALLGHGAFKPFECVGEVEESQAAFYILTTQPLWGDTVLVQRFRQEILPTLSDPQALVERALTPLAAPTLPDEFAELLHAYRRS